MEMQLPKLPKLNTSLRDEWKESNQDFKDVIYALAKRDIKKVHRWIGLQQDPELMDAGIQFLDRLLKSDCKTLVDPLKDRNAYYYSFSSEKSADGKSRGFVNEIVSGINDLRCVENLYSNEVHEGAHSVQSWNCPHTHANPRNPNTDMLLCPEDAMRVEIWGEQFAYAMQGWFNTMLAKDIPEVEEYSNGDPVTVKEFKELRGKNPSLKDTLIAAAKLSMTKARKEEQKFFDYYSDCAFETYGRKLDERKNTNESKLIFIKLGDQAAAVLLKIANACIPGLFNEKDVEELLPLPTQLARNKLIGSEFKFAGAEKLDALNNRCNIINKIELKTLTEVLSARDMTEEEFQIRSRGNCPSYNITSLTNTAAPIQVIIESEYQLALRP